MVRLSSAVGLASRSSAEIVHVPSPLSVPADNTAPSGTPEIVTERDSDPSVSVSAALISREIALSSAPDAVAPTSSVGPSATAATETSKVFETVAVSSPSVVVTSTLSWKSPSEFSGGVMLRPFSCSGVNVALPSLNSIVCVAPSASTYVSVAPSGILPTSIETLSEPSASVETAEISNAIAVSSLPPAAVTVTSASSATADTSTEIEPVVTAGVPPASSVAVAVTPRSMVPEKSSGGVIVKLSNSVESAARSSAEIVQVPSPLSVPADNCAPSGTPEIVIERDSEPSMSVSDAPISSEIAESSAPNAVSPTTNVGASASAATLTSKV